MKVVDTRGNVFYYKDDNKTAHREDGPAFELASGEKWYFWEGKRLEYEEWLQKVDELHNNIVEINSKLYRLELIQEGIPQHKIQLCSKH